MTEEPTSLSRRSVIKAAAWAAPAVAIVAAAPAHASTEPEEATSIGGTATSPIAGNNGFVRVFGLDNNGDEGSFPEGQTFTLHSETLDFDAIVTSVTGGTISGTGPNWILTPNPGSTFVRVGFNSATTGSYSVISNGPVDPGVTYGGNVLPA